MKDFGNDSYSGDCFFLVGQLKGLDCNRAADFVEILEIIDRDLGLGLASGTPVSVPPATVRRAVPDKPEETSEKPVKPYQFREQKFPLAELVYWQQYGITPELLERYKVCSLREYHSETAEGKPYTYTSSVAEPMYGYKGKQHIKLYRPFSTPRFLYGGSFGDNYCFGLEQLPAKGDTLFITGGEKDVLSLAAHGFHAICFNSETVTIPPTLVYRLTFRFKHIVLLFDSGGSIISSQKVGPSIADDIKVSAIWSVVLALIAIGLYILLRFRNIAYSIGSLCALACDTIIILGAYSMFWGVLPFSLEIDQTFIGAILTAIGYSINDKVVIFDRVREFFSLYPKRNKKVLFNDSLNTTLARTINTSLSTLIVLLCIFILGGDSIRSFAFAMILGVVFGTLSSLFVASPIAYMLMKHSKDEEPAAATTI